MKATSTVGAFRVRFGNGSSWLLPSKLLRLEIERYSSRGHPSSCKRESLRFAQARDLLQSLRASATGGPQGAFDESQQERARQRLFNDIAPVYDQLNTTLSLGQHHVWKRMAVKWAGAKQGGRVLDICCGSGDLAFVLADAVGPTGKVTGLDFAQNMLDDAERRQLSRPPIARFSTEIAWVQGDAMDMPFASCSFDAATMGYGLRNVARIPDALRELERVLKPGAKAAILDFNNAESGSFSDAAQAWMLDNVVVPVAGMYGLRDEYEYLRPSIKAFPTGAELERLALEAGFEESRFYEIAFGLMGILVVRKH
mmetsp:Transcript_41008/g.97424  ORF Transcript_41008/g.97424 Transcript_41008/m.97424 type:complete len:312 (-) Transcript_41008:128-1063(-)